MTTFRHTIPVEDQDAAKLVGKVLAEGLSQKELNAAYDDVCRDYDKVSTPHLYIFSMTTY